MSTLAEIKAAVDKPLPQRQERLWLFLTAKLHDGRAVRLTMSMPPRAGRNVLESHP